LRKKEKVSDRLRIAPFAGFRYNPEKIPDLTPVVAPPYDMIPPAQKDILYDRHPHNIVRLILPRDSRDGSGPDRYARATADYRAWKKEKVLLQDPEPSIYAYRQDYEWEGISYQRLGFIARVALAEFGQGAFPHESTLSGPKADRLRLLTASRANFSSIFSLFSDEEGRVQDRLGAETAGPPLAEVVDDGAVTHRLWRLSRPEFHSWLNNQMRDKQFIIADGHHRYETALEYRRLAKERNDGSCGDCDYVMMFLAPMESPGLTILPFHRLLDCGGGTLEKLKKGFEAEAIPLAGDRATGAASIMQYLKKGPPDRPVFVFYQGGDHAYGLILKEDFDAQPFFRPGTTKQVAALDVTVLHQVVFDGLLGFDEQELVQGGRISFFSRPADAVGTAREGDGQAAFFLRATRKEQVWKVAVSGQKMPQKSTNFHPKLTTGLVINEL